MALITREEVVAVFAGSLDPYTLGHNDVVEQALKIFDKVVILIARNPNKNSGLFAYEERKDLVISSLAELRMDASRVDIDFLDPKMMTVKYIRDKGARVLIRSFRSITDWEFELNLAHHNREQEPAVTTIFLIPDQKYQIVSSTAARQAGSLGGRLDYMVSPSVERAIREKYK